MVTITVTGDNAGDALKQLHGFFPHHETAHVVNTTIESPKELKREKKEKPASTEEKASFTSPAPTPYTMVQEIVPKVLKVAKREDLIKLFGLFDGAKSARDLKPEQYQAFIEAAQKMIDAAPKS